MSLADEARAVRQRVASRLRELEPLVREYEDLKRLAAEMGVDETPRGGGQRSAPGSRQRAGGDPVGERVLSAVRSDPGKTVADYAKAMDMPATALYRPVRELAATGVIVKRARQLFPA
jgi:hypothetical protein